MIAQLQNIGTTINSTIPFTDEVMNNLLSFGGLIKSNTSLITTELVNNISDMINNQLKLIEDGVTSVNPHLVNLLDLQLYLSM